jgi:hypothetical protein
MQHALFLDQNMVGKSYFIAQNVCPHLDQVVVV